MSTEVLVTGAFMTPFGKHPGTNVRELSETAALSSLRDAGASPEEVGAVYFGNAVSGLLSGQEMLRGPIALRHTPLMGKPMYNVEGACATSTLAFHLAVTAIRAGQVDVALVVGVEKLTHQDKRRSLAAIGSASDLTVDTTTREQIEAVLLGGNGREQRADDAGSVSRSTFMDMYAELAASYVKRYGATELDFASIAAKNHRHGFANPLAQYGSDITAGDVLDSRRVVGPLTVLMCAPVSDGAAALVVESAAHARRAGRQGVRVRATSMTTRGPWRDGDDTVARRAVAEAYEAAGVGPAEVSVVELHDAVSPAELGLYDELGLCPPGDPLALVRDGATQLGGSVPVNVSGGLVSRGHPVGATGAGQLVELVDQLRGRAGDRSVPDASVALAHNAGGHFSGDSGIAAVTILTT